MSSSPKRVLVAGGAGFIGSHLCEALLGRGEHVTCLDNFLTGAYENVRELEGDPRFTVVHADVVDPVPASIRPDAIFNLACAASPEHYQADPVHTLMTSVVGTRNLLALASERRARMLLASTSEVYGDPTEHQRGAPFGGQRDRQAVGPISMQERHAAGIARRPSLRQVAARAGRVIRSGEGEGERGMSGIRLSMRVWDLPIRLFHWAMVVLIAIAYVSQLEYWMRLHFLAGYAALSLLLFRLVWGFVGSETARFDRFLGNPMNAVRHLAQFRRREEDREIGHNAAGGWMVLVLLALTLAESFSGLFSKDDDITEGPLAHRLSGWAVDLCHGIHDVCWTLILIAVALHLLAILAYWAVKGQNLLRPMITGKKRLPAATRPPRMASTGLALLILAAAGAFVAVVVNVF